MVATKDFSNPTPPRVLDRTVVTEGLSNCSSARLYSFGRNNWIPNNPRLPVVLFETVSGALGTPEQYETFVDKNGWIPQWRDLGIFTYHHYHTVHEALGVLRGSAVFILGGDGGPRVHLQKGNVLALPAGVAHAQLSASDDFLLIGAYTRPSGLGRCGAVADRGTARAAGDDQRPGRRSRVRTGRFPDTVLGGLTGCAKTRPSDRNRVRAA